jgi:anaerobic magnesium-protoporphyrin IX monomethyl ester cyclase
LKEDNLVYALLAEKEYVIAEVDSARNVLDKHFYALPPEEFISNFEKLLCGKALIDAVHFPAQIGFGLGFHGMAYVPCVKDIQRAVNDEKHNFLLPYYRDKVLSMFREEQPGVVGISISHISEFIPAFTLANIIRKESPETYICLGGAVLTEMSHRVSKNLPLWAYFDSMIIGPGEHAFSNLIETIEAQKPLSNIPNLVYHEKGTLKKRNTSIST